MMHVAPIHSTIIGLLLLSLLLTLLAMFLGSDLVKDSWFVALHLAGIWSIWSLQPSTSSAKNLSSVG
jgi:hypothetical protein